MTNIYFLMQEQQVRKYVDSKESIIKARNGMNEKDIAVAKQEVLKECNIYDVDTCLEAFDGKLYEVENGIAKINIAGMLVQKVDFCSAFFGETLTTYKYIREATAEADKDPRVSKILYLSDSGGGYVSGCEETFQVILNAKKPTISAVKNMSASASYWLTSACDEVIGISKTGFTGSIGVAVEIIDRSKAEEEAGYQRIVMTNDSSKNKRPDLLTEDGQAILVKELNDIYNVFVSSILEKRSSKLSVESIADLKGQVFISSEAIEKGLIDKQMTEAELMDYLSVKKINNPSTFGGGNINMEAKMNLADFLKENPEAQKQHDALVKASADNATIAATKAERERGASILNLAGATVPKGVMTAYTEGMTAGDYAVAEINAQNDAVALAGDTDLGALTVKNQNLESDELKNSKKTVEEKAIETAEASVDKFLEGAK